MNNKLAILAIVFILLSSSTIVISKSCLVSSFDLRDEGNISINEEEPKKYAVLMVGRFFGSLSDIPKIHERHYRWYLNDVARFYTMLKDTYGYTDENIFLLVRILPVLSVPDSFKEIENLIDYEASKENLQLVLSKFKPGGPHELGKEDTLTILLINHGGLYADSNGNDGGIDWLSPKGFEESNWHHEHYAYDGDLDTFAYFNKKIDSSYSDPLKLTLDEPTKIRGFRIKANNHYKLLDNTRLFDKIILDFYNDNELVKTFDIDYWGNEVWRYQRFEGSDSDLPLSNSVEISFRLSESKDFQKYPAKVFEFEFWPDFAGYDMTKVYMGCPFLSIPAFLRYLYGADTDNEKMYDYDLADYVKDIKARMIFLLQPCFSGAFINELSGENRIILTASRGSEFADSWIGYIQRALNFEVDADYDKDGRVSILEAYEYAAKAVYERYGDLFHPLIDDNGIYPGHHYTESGYIKNGGDDGNLAANTFLGERVENPSEKVLSRRTPFMFFKEIFRIYSFLFDLIEINNIRLLTS